MTERLLRRREVADLTGMSVSYIEKLSARGAFPEPRQIGERAIAWLGSEVDEWMRTRPKVSEGVRVRPGQSGAGKAA